MKLSTPALLAALLPIAAAQSPTLPSQGPLRPYVRQLGAQAFPGGEAALADGVRAVAPLPAGGVVVAGATYGSLGEPHAGPSNRTDLFVARFDRSGRLLWLRQVGATTAPGIPALNGDPAGPGGNAASWEFADDVAVDASGCIWVTGGTSSSLGETNGGGDDLFVAKFDSGGALLWLRQVGVETAATIAPPAGATLWGDPYSTDRGRSIVFDPVGGVWIGGHTGSDLGENNAGNADFLLARFDADGQLEWLRQVGEVSGPPLGYPAMDMDVTTQLARHPSGELVLAGTSDWVSGTDYSESVVLLTFDVLGEPLAWTGYPGKARERCQGLAIDPLTGRIFVAGETQRDLADGNAGTDTRDVFIASFDAALDLEWTSQLGVTAAATLGLGDVAQDEFVRGLRLDRAGDLILAGSTFGSLDEANAGAGDVFAARFRGADGQALWVRQIGLATANALGLDAGGDDSVGFEGVALSLHGTILLGGATSGDLGETQAGAGDALVIRLSRDGTLD